MCVFLAPRIRYYTKHEINTDYTQPTYIFDDLFTYTLYKSEIYAFVLFDHFQILIMHIHK